VDGRSPSPERHRRRTATRCWPGAEPASSSHASSGCCPHDRNASARTERTSRADVNARLAHQCFGDRTPIDARPFCADCDSAAAIECHGRRWQLYSGCRRFPSPDCREARCSRRSAGCLGRTVDVAKRSMLQLLTGRPDATAPGWHARRRSDSTGSCSNPPTVTSHTVQSGSARRGGASMRRDV
jgi:hypothetical protein